MRILSIGIRNLASLAGTQPLVRFGEGGLSGGLIAVTGPTGAGKSTLLDALCLGLYGATPRLPTGSDDLHPKNILTRDASDGFAEVEFEGGDGRRYRSRWEIRVARTGTVQPPQMDLVSLDTDEHLERGVLAVRARVAELVGLDREQFIGVALLAQGSFSAFLKGQPDQRGALLERLTGAGRYAALGRAAHLDAQRVRRDVEALQQRLGEHHLLDPAARAEAEERVQATGVAVREGIEREQLARRQVQRLDELQASVGQLASERARLDAAVRAQEMLAPEIQRLERAERVEPLRAGITRLRERESALEQAQQDARQAEGAVLEANDGIPLADSALARFHDALVAADTTLTALRDRALWARPADPKRLSNALGLVDRHARACRGEQDAQSALAAARDGLQAIGARVAEARATLAQRIAVRTACESGLESARQTMSERLAVIGDGARLGETLERRRQLSAMITAAGTASGVIAEAQRRQVSAEQRGAQARATAAALQAGADGLRAGLVVAESLLALRRAAADVVEHRHVLIVGEPCPLCAQSVEVLPQEPPDDRAFATARAEVERLTADLERSLSSAQAEGELAIRAEAEREQSALAVANAEEQLRVIDERWTAWRSDDPAMPGSWQACTPEDARALVDQATALRRDLDAASAAVEQAGQALAQAQVEERLGREAAGAAEREVASHDERVRGGEALLQRSIADRTSACSALAVELAALAEELGRTAPTVEGARDWLEARAADHERWAELDALARQWQPRVSERLAAARELVPDLGDHIAPDGQSNATLAAVGAEVARCCAALGDATAELGSARQRHATALANAERTIRVVSERNQALIDARDVLLAEAARANLASEAEVEAALMPADMLRGLRERVAAGRDALTAARSSVQTATTRVTEARAAFSPPGPPGEEELTSAGDMARTALSDAERTLGDARSAAEQARRMVAADDQSREYAGRLAAEIELANRDLHRADNLRQCIGSATGHKFRDIAQQLTLDVLATYANQRLRRFAPRYALQRRQGLELEVVDRDLADEVRPVNTLSGGESFLVSLGLALALADLKRGRAEVGNVFIDEGFGSLDQASLDRALAALEAVQDDLGAQVVVISHVGELHNRWAEHVEVRRVSRTSSWLVVPGGSERPTREQASAGVTWLPDLDMDAVVTWLAGEDGMRTRRAIAEAAGLDADDRRLAGALRDDARIERTGQRYGLAQQVSSAPP